MDDFERRVMAEIGRLDGSDFPTGLKAKRQREATIKALAQAVLEGRSWTGDNGVLGPNRPSTIVGDRNFYSKKHWYPHPLVKEVIENVTALYVEREAQETEKARQAKRSWLENKELEAAETQFEKAGDLLALPHIAKKTKQGKDGEGTTIILDPANAAVFNAAVNLNKAASELARRSLGLPLEVKRSELTGADGEAIQEEVYVREHRERLVAEVARKAALHDADDATDVHSQSDG